MPGYTQTQLDELEEAIAAGVLTVKHGDKLVTYRSLAEMLRLADLIRQALAAPSSRRPLCGYISHSRG